MEKAKPQDARYEYYNSLARSKMRKDKKKHLMCKTCKTEFLTKTGMKSHTKDECDEKKHLLEHSTCKDCGRKFDSLSAFESHITSCLWFKSRISPKQSYVYRQIVAAKISPLSIKTLVFGGTSKPSSLVGAVSFFIVDNSSNFIIVERSEIFHLSFQSLVRLHFQSLLVGLVEASKLGIQSLEITGDTFVVSHFSNQNTSPSSFFSTVFSLNKDVISSIHEIIKFFNNLRFSFVTSQLQQHCERIGNNSSQLYDDENEGNKDNEDDNEDEDDNNKNEKI